MKKALAMLTITAIAAVSVADISVEFKSSAGTTIMNDGYTFPPSGGGQVLDSGNLVQLVWSAANTGYQSDDLAASLANSGEYILTSGYAGFSGVFDLGTGTYADSNVDNVDINAGYFFLRIFDSAAPTAGSYFLELGIQGPALTEYDVQATGTIYKDWIGASTASISDQGTQVVPEPATIGLFGLGALSAWFIRRSKKQAREEA